MDLKQRLIQEFKAKNINFDDNDSLGGYIDDSFDGVFECIDNVLSKPLIIVNEISEEAKNSLIADLKKPQDNIIIIDEDIPCGCCSNKAEHIYCNECMEERV